MPGDPTKNVRAVARRERFAGAAAQAVDAATKVAVRTGRMVCALRRWMRVVIRFNSALWMFIVIPPMDLALKVSPRLRRYSRVNRRRRHRPYGWGLGGRSVSNWRTDAAVASDRPSCRARVYC